MKKFGLLLNMIAMLGLLLTPFGESMADVQAWRMYGGGPRHTFSTSEDIKLPLKVDWEYRTGGGFFSKSGAAFHRGMYLIPLAGGELHAINETTGKEVWKLVLPDDRLVSTPVPANDFIVITTQSGKIHVLLTSSGSIKWTFDVKNTISNPPMVSGGLVYAVADNGIAVKLALQGLHLLNSYDLHSQITTQPLLTDKGVCTATKNGLVTMLDKNLKPTWSIKSDGEIAGTICQARNYVVFLNKRGMLFCYDTDSGHFSWQLNIGNDSPAGLVSDGYQVFSSSTRGTIFAINGLNGDSNWTYKIDGDIISRPVVTSGKIYISTINKQIFCLATSDGSLLWSVRTDQSISCGLTASSKTLLALPRVGNGYCLSLNKGEASWIFNTGGIGRIPPIVDGNNVCGAFSDGTISFIDSTLGKPLWEKKLGAEISASPAMTGDRIIAGTTDETVFCLDNNSGKTIWKSYVPYYVNSPPAVSGKFVFLGTWGGELVSLETKTGTKRWSQPTNAEIKTSPSVSVSSVYVGSWDSNIYSYDYQTGTLQWQMPTSYNLNQCISLGSDQGYIPTKDQVVCIKLKGGVPLWTEKLDSQIIGELSINEDSIFALTNNGYLYRLNGKGTRIWTKKVDTPHTSRSISIIGDYICLTTGSILKFYDISNGKLKWQYECSSPVSQPVFSGGKLFVTTDIGSLVCLSYDNTSTQSNQNWDLTLP